MLSSANPLKAICAPVTADVHSEQFRRAAERIIDACKLDYKLEDDSPAASLPVLQQFLHYLLNNNGMQEAAQLLWSPKLFDPTPKCSQDVWKLFDEVNFGLLMGAASMSKSYTMGVRLMLEWLRDPRWTTVRVLGPSADHLEANLFSHLVALHAASKLPLPGEVGQLYIGLDRRDLLSSIKGIIIPIGQNKRSGRLQGMKRKPRPEEHPEFGPLSRMLIFLDEISNIPSGIWKDVDNIMANVEDDANFAKGFKIFGAFNPTNQGDEVANRCTPISGWEGIDADRDFRWKSPRGWEVLRLDALQSENVKAGRTIYPGLQTAAGVAAITKNAGGTESPGYYSMVRAMFPPTGAVLSVIPQGMVVGGRGEFIWFTAPEPVGGVDLALEGGATAIFTHGQLGMASGYKRPSTIEFPAGEIVMFKSAENRKVTPRWALQIVQQYPLAKGATVAMKDSVVSLARKLGIRPQNLCVDRTGHGAGVADLIKYEFGPVIDVNYSSGASEMKIMEEDSMTCKEEFERMASELWFAAKKWMEFKSCLIHPQIDMTRLSTQLTQRLFRMLGKKSRVEKKQDYIARGFPSPDEADSFTLTVHAARIGSKITLSMTGATPSSADVDDEGWSGETEQRIDVTNRPQHLDEGGDGFDDDHQ
jgi:hypothetical protein